MSVNYRNLFGVIGYGIIGLSLLLSGCATSVISESHPQFASVHDLHANVYFFRPLNQRTRGVADNDVNVEIGKNLALKLSVGEYALLKLRPGETNVTLRNMTYLTFKVMPEEVWRSRKFNFEANKTYFVQALFKQEEFRGIYFNPVEVEEEEAIKIVSTLKPAGEATMNEPVRAM